MQLYYRQAYALSRGAAKNNSAPRPGSAQLFSPAAAAVSRQNAVPLRCLTRSGALPRVELPRVDAKKQGSSQRNRPAAIRHTKNRKAV